MQRLLADIHADLLPDVEQELARDAGQQAGSSGGVSATPFLTMKRLDVVHSVSSPR